MKPIGGFFELELPIGNKKENQGLHKNALLLSTGRACLNLIIHQEKPNTIYLPYYSCDSILEPVILNKIAFKYYNINSDLEIKSIIELKKNDILLYINYFGLKNNYVKKLLKIYGKNLILDNTQAFFEKAPPGKWTFNSARKFFGVPDGAYLYGPVRNRNYKRNTRASFSHLIKRLVGLQQKAFKEFQNYEKSITPEIKCASLLSEYLLRKFNYNAIAQQRKTNFRIYSKAFKNLNKLKTELSPGTVPFAYPLYISKKVDKKKLFHSDIFIPTLWPEIKTRKFKGFSLENDFSENLLPLPVDHRYGIKDMNKVIEAIRSLM